MASRKLRSASIGLGVTVAAFSAFAPGVASADDGNGGVVRLGPDEARNITPKDHPPDSAESVNSDPWAAYREAAERAKLDSRSAPAAEPAATTSWYGCPDVYACFYVDTNFKSAMGKVQGNNPDWSAFPRAEYFWGNLKDCASSAINRRPSDIFGCSKIRTTPSC